jgi:hypothetical protein
MNLIEKLGGYEKAKEALIAEQRSKNIDPVIYINGDEVLIDAIDDALLQYRRQHNIYEAGDLVVMADADDYDTIFKVIGKPQRLYHLQGNDDLFYGRLDFQIRHATDEEIEAGKRLEVN